MILQVLPGMPSSSVLLGKTLVHLPGPGFTLSVLSSWSPQTPSSGPPAASQTSFSYGQEVFSAPPIDWEFLEGRVCLIPFCIPRVWNRI